MSFEKVTKKEFDYFMGRLNFGASALDAKAIDIMNRLYMEFTERGKQEENEQETS